MLFPDPHDEAARRLQGRFRAELLDRLTSPLYAFAAGLIGFAALGEARTTRQGRGVAIGVAVLTFTAVRLMGIAATTFVVSKPNAEFFIWSIPLVTCLACFDAIFAGPLSRVSARIGRISVRSRAKR